MKKNTPYAVPRMSDLGIFNLKVYMRDDKNMESEFAYIHYDGNDVLDKKATRLWEVLTYRPDVACRAVELCRDDKIVGLPALGDLLEEAIEDAEWPKDIW